MAASLLALVAITAGLYAGVRWLYDNRTRSALPPAAVIAPPKAPAASPALSEPEVAPRHPLERAAPATPLTLDNSDAALLADMSRLAGVHGLLQWLLPTNVVRHIVATVDALPRRQVPLQVLPTRPVPGNFVVSQYDDETVIGSDNGERYLPYVHLLTSIDPAAAASSYRRFYPLFQQAYRNLGYPKGYFNDRLIEAIDDALATSEVPTPIRVEAPRAMWRYVDPDIEALSAGQRILLRMGEANVEAVRAWLKAFRASVVEVPPVPDDAGATYRRAAKTRLTVLLETSRAAAIRVCVRRVWRNSGISLSPTARFAIAWTQRAARTRNPPEGPPIAWPKTHSTRRYEGRCQYGAKLEASPRPVCATPHRTTLLIVIESSAVSSGAKFARRLV